MYLSSAFPPYLSLSLPFSLSFSARFRQDKLFPVKDYPSPPNITTPLRYADFVRALTSGWNKTAIPEIFLSARTAYAQRNCREEMPASTSAVRSRISCAFHSFSFSLRVAYRSDLIYMAHARSRKYTERR